MKSFAQHLAEEVKGTYTSDKYKVKVDDVIKLSKDIETQEKNVDDLIKTNSDTQTKEGLFADLLKKPNKAFMKRVEDADMKYPILIDSDDYIIDGAHRLAKAYFAKQKTIKVKVITEKILKEAEKMNN